MKNSTQPSSHQSLPDVGDGASADDLERGGGAGERPQSQLLALFNAIPDEVWVSDTRGRFVLANASAIREFHLGTTDGVEVEKLAKALEVFRPDGSLRPVEEAPPLRALAGNVIASQEEVVRTPATGELRYRQVSAAPVRDAAGTITGSISIVRDITEHRKAEQRVIQLNRLLRTISAVNQLIVHEPNRELLLHETCRILVECGRFRMAWVGLMDRDSGLVKPVSSAGFDAGYTETIRVRWDESAEGQGPTGTAIRTGEHVVFADAQHHANYAPWREQAQKREYRSSAAFPLRVRGQVVGALSVYMDAVGAITAEDVALLDELAMNLGYALQTLDDRATREQAEADLKVSEERFHTVVETAPEAIFIQTGGGFAYVNAAGVHLFGASRPEELLGQPVSERFHPDSRARVRERLRRLNEERQAVSMAEEVGLKLDGTRVELEVAAVPFIYQGQAGALVFARDVTGRKQAVAAIQAQLDELQRWHQAMLGRETRILELKREVNALLAKQDQPAKYESAVVEEEKNEDLIKTQ